MKPRRKPIRSSGRKPSKANQSNINHVPTKVMNPPVRERRDLVGWPGTLPSKRMNNLINSIETGHDPGSDEIITDMKNLIRAEECFKFSTQEPQMEEETPQFALTGTALSLHNLESLTKVAWNQDGFSTIGGILSMVASDGKKENRVIFKLLRDPEWIGYNPMLPMVKGLNITISESREMLGRPGIISAEPAEDGFPPGTTQMFPLGEGNQLAAILRWHEAKEVRWRPQHEGTEPTSWYHRPVRR